MAKILVAEDERRIRDSFVDILVYAGYDVIEAEDGRTAFEVALREHPDLILLDLMDHHDHRRHGWHRAERPTHGAG